MDGGDGGRGGFDPAALTLHASVNELRIEALPGVPPELVGRRGHDLLARQAVVALLRSCGVATDGPHLTAGLARQTTAPDRQARAAAEAATAIGRRLGYLLATLADPATARRQGSAPERRAYLTHWSSHVGRVWLAGGLMAAGVGRRVAPVVRRTLRAVGHARPEVVAADRAELLPLLGAARGTAPDDGLAVVLDCGHTSIKRGLATVRRGTLAALDLLPAVPVPAGGHDPARVTAVVADVLAATVRAADRRATDAAPVHPRVRLAVASYVRDGLPIPDGRGIYGELGRASGHLADIVTAALGATATVTFVHDGTAAWHAVADRDGTGGTEGGCTSAVLTLGTTLGVGLGPQPGPRLPLAPDLRMAPAPA